MCLAHSEAKQTEMSGAEKGLLQGQTRRTGAFETVELRLGLEPMHLDSNPAKTQTGTWTHGLLTEITHLVSGLIEVPVLMSHRRKNPVRDKVIGKKWIYLERNTLTDRVRAISGGESGARE